MRHAKLFALSLFATSLLYNNCSGFQAVTGDSSLASSSGSGGFQLGIDPHPEQYPAVMGTPSPRDPETVSPVVTYPAKQTELAKVASNFDVNEWINEAGADTKPTWNGFDDVGAFRFQCKPSHNLYDDPVVYPGQPGLSHLHTFFGNRSSNAYSTYASLRASGDGTCVGGPINRSAYWFPALRVDDGDGNDLNDKVFMPDFTSVYYKMKPLQSTMMARGLRIIFGYNMNNPAASNATFNWECLARPEICAAQPATRA